MMRRILQRISLKQVLALGAGITLVTGLMFGGFLFYLAKDLPTVEELVNPEYSLPSKIYDRQGQLVEEVFVKRRKLIEYEDLPPHLINGLVAKEDTRFFEHHGIDPLRMLKAGWINLLCWCKKQGASTLTQQTARQFFLTLKRTWVRKFKEILLAISIENRYSKEKILTLYLNKVNFGDAYGVSAAAEYYFDKKVGDLSLSESGVLVGLLPSPNKFKPTRNLQLSKKQRNIVLARMAEEGFITRSEQMAAASEPIILAERSNPRNEAVAYYVELVRRQLLRQFGSKKLYEGGLHVYTAMDINYQITAHEELAAGLRDLDRRRGYRVIEDRIELEESGRVPEELVIELNPGRELDTGKVLSGIVLEVDKKTARIALAPYEEGIIAWKILKETWKFYYPDEEAKESLPLRRLADILAPGKRIQVEIIGQDPESGKYLLDLNQEPLANGSIYSMNPKTGEVLAMVGGVRFGREKGSSEFIRATQAVRQPGSAFKPIVYAAALEEGYSPATILTDSPRVFTLSTGRKHSPQNYDGSYLGRISLRESLFRSRNVPTVQLVDQMGARRVIEYARKFGISTAIPEESIIALGTHSLKLSELTRAYGVFPNGGKLVTPVYIMRIEDSNGVVLYENVPESQQVISESTAYMITDILRDVVRHPLGTGYRAMKDLGRPAGGKTGTTQNNTDAWYLGFIPQLVTGVYVGFDDPNISLGKRETGSKAAAPIWKNYVSRVVKSMPIEGFPQPESVITMRVDENGKLLSSCDTQFNSRYELFAVKSVSQRQRMGGACNTGTLRTVSTKNFNTPSANENPDDEL